MGIITKIQAWIQHPTYDTKSDPKAWLYFLALVLIISFLWSRVIKQLVEN